MKYFFPQVLCNTKFGETFKTRRSKNVPVFSTTSKPWANQTSVRNVKCAGTEEDLIACPMDADRMCETNAKVHVQCAVCTPQDLLDAFKNIKIGVKTADMAESVNAALKDLEEKCLDWDCSVGVTDRPYPEYCQIKAALKQALVYLQVPNKNVSIIQVQS